jgi:hypothetical protein
MRRLRIRTSMLAKTRRLTDILDCTSILRPRGLARENSEQAAREEILIIRDGAMVVVTGSPKVECGGCGMQVRSDRGPLVVLINTTNKVGCASWTLMGLIGTRSALYYSFLLGAFCTTRSYVGARMSISKSLLCLMKLRASMVWRQATMRPRRSRGWSGQTQCGRPEGRPPSENKKRRT